jgi:hypothetical protein
MLSMSISRLEISVSQSFIKDSIGANKIFTYNIVTLADAIHLFHHKVHGHNDSHIST